MFKRYSSLLLSSILLITHQSWAESAVGVAIKPIIINPAETEVPVINKSDWKKDKLTIYIDVQHYDWHSDSNTSGHQTVMPFTAMYRVGHGEFGLRTAWINSVNTTEGRQGSVDTVSDTALSAAYTQILQNGWDIRYNLDYNIPTGKASLAGIEKFAIMDGNLVSQTRFGEGHNITPGFVVSKALNSNSAVGMGLSHTVRGSYDPNSDVENDQLNPGNETRLTLQGQYGAEKFMLIGGVVYTKSETTQFDSLDYFRKGDRRDVNLTGIFAFPYAQTIILGMRYGAQNSDTYVSSITGNFDKEGRNINGNSKYISAEYIKKWRDMHSFKLMADWLKHDANSYDQFNDLYNAGRIKYSFGAGYEFKLDNHGRISIAVRDFKMNDKATPATLVDTKYSGFNVTVGLNVAF